MKLSKPAARTHYSFGLTMFFILCISITCGQFLPHARGRILHPVWNLQKDAVRLIPALTDAGDQPGIFQLPQGGFDRPLTPVKVIRHLLDRIDHLHIPILGRPAAFLGKHGAVEQKPI